MFSLNTFSASSRRTGSCLEVECQKLANYTNFGRHYTLSFGTLQGGVFHVFTFEIVGDTNLVESGKDVVYEIRVTNHSPSQASLTRHNFFSFPCRFDHVEQAAQ
jgi:hypothetical protein